MTEKITLNNKEYICIPVEEWEEVQMMLKDYLSGKVVSKPVVEEKPEVAVEIDGVNVKIAQPKVSEYRERFKRRELTRSDVTAKPTEHERLIQFDKDDFDKFRDKDGKALFFGGGLEEDYV